MRACIRVKQAPSFIPLLVPPPFGRPRFRFCVPTSVLLHDIHTPALFAIVANALLTRLSV